MKFRPNTFFVCPRIEYFNLANIDISFFVSSAKFISIRHKTFRCSSLVDRQLLNSFNSTELFMKWFLAQNWHSFFILSIWHHFCVSFWTFILFVSLKRWYYASENHKKVNRDCDIHPDISKRVTWNVRLPINCRVSKSMHFRKLTLFSYLSRLSFLSIWSPFSFFISCRRRSVVILTSVKTLVIRFQFIV